MIAGIKPWTATWKREMCERMEEWLLLDLANFLLQQPETDLYAQLKIYSIRAESGDDNTGEFSVWIKPRKKDGKIIHNAVLYDYPTIRNTPEDE